MRYMRVNKPIVGLALERGFSRIRIGPWNEYLIFTMCTEEVTLPIGEFDWYRRVRTLTPPVLPRTIVKKERQQQ